MLIAAISLSACRNVPPIFGMRFAMSILALLCLATGLFPGLVTKYLTQPAATAIFSANAYINAMMGGGYAESTMASSAETGLINFAETGVWSPISWLCLLMILLIAVCIVALSSKYDRVSEKVPSAPLEGKYDLFFGGEESVYSQVGGEDLFWGFKHNWRHYFSFMHELHSGVVNDYALWAVVALALAIVFLQIAL